MKFEKEKTVLMVMDFMNDIVHPDGKFSGWGVPAHVQQQNAIENTKELLSKVRRAGIKVIYITVSYDDNYPELDHSKIPMYVGMKQGQALLKNRWGGKIHEYLQPREGEIILNKTRINPFTLPQLRVELTEKKTLLLAGVATNFVVEECARTAAAEDYEVIVLEDCCASMNQEMHDFSIKNILSNLVKIIDSKTVEF